MDLERTSANLEESPITGGKNIIQEINALNQQMQSSSNEIYKISSSWDKHSHAQNNKNVEITIKEMMNYIIKMDTVLTKINATLIKMNTDLIKVNTALIGLETAFFKDKNENKHEAKSFWDNFHF